MKTTTAMPKRIGALMLAIIMCFSMFPATAFAEEEDNSPESVVEESVCEHVWDKWKIKKEATCTEEGKKERTCTICGEIEKKAIAIVPHSFGDWKVTEEPTCTEKGEKERVCADCGKTETKAIPVSEHSFGEWEIVEEPTCTEKGKKERICNDCGEIETKAIPVTDHSFGDWRVVEEPTCTEKGEKERVCADCGKTETKAIEVSDHSFGEWEIVEEPTCTEKGKKERVCADCGKTETKAIPVADHSFGDWEIIKEATCTKKGKQEHVCTICGETEEEAIPVADHSFGDWEIIKEATCTKKGKQEHVCTVCGETEAETIPVAEHNLGDWEIIKEATCTEEGKQERSCTICGETETEAVPAFGHDRDEDGVCIVCEDKPQNAEEKSDLADVLGVAKVKTRTALKAGNEAKGEPTEAAFTVYVKGTQQAKPYNGAEQNVTGYTLECEDPLYDESKVVGPKQSEAVAKGTTVKDSPYAMGLTEGVFSYDDESVTVKFEVTDGSLTIEQVKLTIKAEDSTVPYNGQTQGEGDTAYGDPAVIAEKVSVEGLQEGDELASIIVFNQGKEAREYSTVPSNAVIKHGETTVTESYDIEYINGKLNIEPLEIKVTVPDKTTDYTGSEQKGNEEYTFESLLEGHTASINYTPSCGTDSGVYNNGEFEEDSFRVLDGENDVTDNYRLVEKTPGKLTITGTPMTITVKGGSVKKEYNGDEQEYVCELTVESDSQDFDPEKFSYSGSMTAKGTNVGDYTTELDEESCVYSDGAYSVTWEIADPVKLTITPKAATVAADDVVKTFKDKDPKFTATVTGTVGSDKLTYSFSRAKGEKLGKYKITVKGDAVQGNYKVTYKPGTLEIVNTDEIVVVIRGVHVAVKYDGNYHKIIGYDAQCNNKEYSKGIFIADGSDPYISYKGPNGLYHEVDITILEKNVGTYTLDLSKIKFANVNPSFKKVRFVISKSNHHNILTILPRDVVLTSASDEKNYDGNPLTNDNVRVTGDGFVKNEGADYKFTGSQTEEGSSKNTFTYTLTGGAQAYNYNITRNYGTLTVKAAVPGGSATAGDEASKTANDETADGTVPTGSNTGDDGVTTGSDAGGNGTPSGSDAGSNGTPAGTDADGNVTPPDADAAGDAAGIEYGRTDNGTVPTEQEGTADTHDAKENSSWSLLNLVAMGISVVAGGSMLASGVRKKKDEDDGTVRSAEETAGNAAGKGKFLGVIPGIGALATFLLTQNMGANMVLADKWTAPMAVIAAVSAGLAFVTRKPK